MLIPLKDENPTRRFAWVNVTLIVANVAVFIYELTQGANLNSFLIYWGFRPSSLLASPLFGITRIFTSMFLHAGFLHIGGNMLYLFIFGNNIEDVLGHYKYILFYFLCGMGAAVGHFLSAPQSTVISLGASGAIAGVLAAYIILFPRARVLTIIPIFFFIQLAQIPALFVIGFWALLQFISGFESLNAPAARAAGGVAYFAHIGGFLSGLLLVFLIPHPKPPPPPPPSREW